MLYGKVTYITFSGFLHDGFFFCGMCGLISRAIDADKIYAAQSLIGVFGWKKKT